MEPKKATNPSEHPIKYLQKYLESGSEGPLNSPKDILFHPEAIDHFAETWDKFKPDLMAMMTAIEYEFIAKEQFGPEAINAMRYFIGNLALFMKGCSLEKEMKEKARAAARQAKFEEQQAKESK